MTRISFVGGAAVSLALTGVVRTALADSSASERALAETLFREAKGLMEQRRFEEACPKFAESQRLDPGGGTLLNLALCHEKEGKTATAWAEFQDARAIASKDGRGDREALAEQHVAALEPKLAKLVVTVARDAATQAGFLVQVDGARLEAPAWGTPAPVDPGDHVVHASALGTTDWEKTVTATAGSSVTVEVPSLASETAPISNGRDRAMHDMMQDVRTLEVDEGKRTAAYIVGGAGVVALGVGTYFGLRALSLRHQSDDHCPADRCTPEGVRLNDSAKRSALGADIGVGVGIGAVAVATYLFVTSSHWKPGDSRAGGGAPLVPVVGPGVAGLFVRRAF